MFRRILIANRGEIAHRIARAARELGLEAVAVYSEADRHSPYLQEVADKICIGPGPAPKSYLNYEAILQAGIQKECQAVHPGYGFLAENALFSSLCDQQKLTFIGPSGGAINMMGDKVQAKRSMEALGVPVLPGHIGRLYDVEEAVPVAEKIGYPVLVKACSGGGGKGMRLCENESELRENFPMASLQALQAFGDPAMYLEKYLRQAKHIEFQIVVDRYGNGVHLAERECSIQRNHQKLIEESPSPAMDDETRKEIGESTAKALARVGYTNAGTVEFLMPEPGELYFMEVNTRLQVEHPVTEMVTGTDLVQEQIQVAARHKLSWKQEDISLKGHAVECRINAEDPEDNFKPCPGTLEKYQPPSGDGIRLDTHVVEGYTIPPYYDSMIAKLIVHDETREKAIEKTIKALDEFHIEGVKTTIPLLKKVLASDQFRSGEYHIHSLGEIMS